MPSTIIMSKKELEKVPVLTRLRDGRINNLTAAKLAGVGLRQIKRLKKRFAQRGVEGLIHQSRGQQSHNRLTEALKERTVNLLKKDYSDFKPTLAMEKLEENHGLKLSKETIRQLMIKGGLWIPKQDRLKAHYRSWRERKEQYGEMEQYDGSRHDWFEGRLPECTLLLAIDDATGELTHGRLASDEGVINTFLFWQDYLLKHGKPLSIYLDRYSTYKINVPHLQDDPLELTQFQRAMDKDLSIKVIHARSPEAKGRIERVFHTLQDRLVKELRLVKVKSLEEANRFLTAEYIPKFNRKFAVAARRSGNLHRQIAKEEFKALAGIMSVHTPRRINNDFTVRHKGIWYQLADQQPTLVLKKDMVMVEEHLDNSIHLKKGRDYLIFMVLPERPQKVLNLPIAGLTPKKQFTWKPPPDHPWRKGLQLKPVEVLANHYSPLILKR